jgi:hypothetical protein
MPNHNTLLKNGCSHNQQKISVADWGDSVFGTNTSHLVQGVEFSLQTCLTLLWALLTSSLTQKMTQWSALKCTAYDRLAELSQQLFGV